ncbi:transcriptional regulator Myc-like [Daphnia pulex]|uniref:transcriptional regulator Myc-like n=1 Tax=Daphnia pulex TaxID=6669 RepID=UPI001EDE5B8C|nr:transcriptional regulator Myc-like [Daphnia pulex]
MTRHLIFVVLVGVSVWMMEAKAIPAIKRRPSLQSNVRSLFSSLEVDDMMPAAVPAMMMMPSFVYYHVVSPFHSPFHRMAKSMMPMWSKFGFESSEEEEEEEEEAEESKKIEEIAKIESKKLVKESGINPASSAEEKESNVESPQEEEEEETQTENEQVTTESVTEETQSIDGNLEDQVPTTEFPAANTESTDPPTTEEEDNSINTEATTTEFQQMDDKAIIVEDQLLITKSHSHPVKTSSGRSSSTTYVCKFGKCQHTMEAKKLLEQEIEAELWAKL